MLANYISDLISDRREKLVPGHSFIVTLGVLVLSFSKVSNIATQIEYDAINEGGNNDYPLLFRKPKTNPDTLILERGVRTRATDLAFDLLREGVQVELGTILVMKNGIDLQKAFYFKKGIIVKRQFSDLDAMSNDLFIESMEIAHTGLVQLDI